MAYLTEAEHLRVSQAVAAAEMQTSGEIVTIVADRSDGYTDIALIWAISAAFFAIGVFGVFPHTLLNLWANATGHWNADHSAGDIVTVASGIGILTFILVLLVQNKDAIRFALIPGRIKTARAEARAVALFKVGAESKTAGRTGVLIYLSMQEHRAEIIADEAIDSRVPEEQWGEAMAALLAELRHGRCADGMIAAVNKVGAILAEHLPRADDDRNELPDRLIEL